MFLLKFIAILLIILAIVYIVVIKSKKDDILPASYYRKKADEAKSKKLKDEDERELNKILTDIRFKSADGYKQLNIYSIISFTNAKILEAKGFKLIKPDYEVDGVVTIQGVSWE